jgi:hypothetical protein
MLFLLANLILSPLVFADILFLDVNDSEKEVLAAKEAAKKSGRKIVVVPDVDENTKKQLRSLNAIVENLQNKRNDECHDSGYESDECQNLEIELSKKQEEVVELQDKVQINVEKIRDVLKKREETNSPFSTMIISGHDGTGEFSGVYGNITDEAISKLFASFPKQSKAMRSLHLWGCYTTSPASLLNNWLHYFPNTALISGYDDQAPLNDKPAGWKYLKGVLEKENELLNSTDAKKLQRLLKKIPGAAQTHSAIYVCGQYANNTEAFDLSELSSRCEKYKEEVERLSEGYMCYKRATDANCSEPPETTSSGPIREFYEALHKADACNKLAAEDENYIGYNRDEALRLIFYREVKKNFARVYQKQLREMDELMNTLGVNSLARFSKVDSMSRAEMIKAVDALKNHIQKTHGKVYTAQNKIMRMSTKTEKDRNIKALMNLHRSLARTLVSLNSTCVPFNWIESNKNDVSPCVPKKSFLDEVVITPTQPRTDELENPDSTGAGSSGGAIQED